MKKRSVMIAGHSSSITLEEEFWRELKSIAKAQHKSVNDLVTEIDAGAGGKNLSSAIRLFILRHLKAQ